MKCWSNGVSSCRIDCPLNIPILQSSMRVEINVTSGPAKGKHFVFEQPANFLFGRAADAHISLDLASFTVVESSKELLEIIVKDFVDILIANEDEAYAFTGSTNELIALSRMSNHVEIAAIKLGEQGSLISFADKVIKVEPKGPIHAIDTTGAGDLWASGFLFGLTNGYGLEKSGELGSACGYEVCKVIGAKIPDEGWKKIEQLLEE